MTLTQKTERTYRASAANLNWLCPAAAHAENDEVLINPVDDAGTVNSFAHEGYAAIVRDREFDVEREASRRGFTPAQIREVKIKLAVAAKWWRLRGGAFGPFTDGLAIVHDWKGTRLEAVDYHPQMMEYLWLLWNAPPEPLGLSVECELRAGAITGHPDVMWIPWRPRFLQYSICFTQDGTEIVSGTKEKPYLLPEEVQEWHDEYMKHIAKWDGRTYNSGGHCQYCPRQTACPGLRRQLALTAALVTSADLEDGINDATPALCVDLWEKSGLLAGLLGKTRDIIKARAERQGGSLQGDGKALVLRKEEWEIIADPQKAWPVLKTELTDDEIKGCIEVSKKAVLDLIADKAPKRGKGKAKEAFMDQLRAAGALGMDGRIMPRIVAALPAASEKEITDNGEEAA